MEDYPLFVTLGVYRGDRFDPFREEDYANRLCVADVRDPNMANINGIAAFYRMRNTPRFQALLRRMDLLQ